MSVKRADMALATRILAEVQRAHKECHRTPCPMHMLAAADIQEILDVGLVQSQRCCDHHGRACEPPSELCCGRCSEGAHPDHGDRSLCSAPDVWRRYGPEPR